MKCVAFFFALLAVWVGSSQATKCSEVTTCAPDASVMQGEPSSQEDIDRVCRAVRDAITCFQSAMQDCRESGTLPEDTIQQLETQMQNYDQILSSQCSQSGGGGGSSGAGAVKMSAMFMSFVLFIVVLVF